MRPAALLYAAQRMDAVEMQLALGRAPGLTAQQLRRALAAIEGAQASSGGLQGLFRQCRSSLESLGLAAAAGAALQAPDAARIAADRRWVESERVTLIDAAGAHYPPLLAQAEGAPALLYVKGDAACLSSPQLAMVGSRNPTQPGERTARAFAGYLSAAGLTITSGLAAGIDAASHEGALDSGGATIAVLGTGIDAIYPRQHRTLAARIAAGGALVSEYPPGSPPIRANFPAPQPHHQRPVPGHAGGRGGAPQRLADHRAPGRRAGSRGVCHPRFDPQSTGSRLPCADQERRETRGKRRRHPQRA